MAVGNVAADNDLLFSFRTGTINPTTVSVSCLHQYRILRCFTLNVMSIKKAWNVCGC